MVGWFEVVAFRRLTLRSATGTAQRAFPTYQRASHLYQKLASKGICGLVPGMNVPRRKVLPHEIPLWADTEKEVYFISFNCQVCGRNQLALPEVAGRLFETVLHRQEKFLWWPHVFLLMPDHGHALLSFPPSGKSLKLVVEKWKEWTAKEIGVVWQRGFFEHRLRQDESRREKADYILRNPVRKKLVERPEDWPFVYFADGERMRFGG